MKNIPIMTIVLALVFASLPTHSEEIHALASTNSPEGSIKWVEWSEEAFDRAMAEDKLILLDLTAVWCHACHVMDSETYSESNIVTLLNTKFIPIRVDTDQRPDVDSRYRSGGWPTTSILLPTGEILFQANSMGPEELGEALRESEEMYRKHKSDLVNHAKEIWQKVEQAKQNQKIPKAQIDPTIPANAIRVMQESYDATHGGFRDAPKFFEPEAITLAFHLEHQFPQENLKQIALFTLDQQMKLIDPVWGGFYRYATKADWSHPHYEKMLNIQALNLLNYLEAYQVTGDKRYKKVVEGTIEYVNRFLSELHEWWILCQSGCGRKKCQHNNFGGRLFPSQGEGTSSPWNPPCGSFFFYGLEWSDGVDLSQNLPSVGSGIIKKYCIKSFESCLDRTIHARKRVGSCHGWGPTQRFRLVGRSGECGPGIA